jgi:hypothetical protein
LEEGGILSLIYEMMEKCCILNKIREDDDYGSETITWSDGTSFDASIIKDSTTEAIVAERQGIKEIFTVVTKKGFSLSYNDYFKRITKSLPFVVRFALFVVLCSVGYAFASSQLVRLLRLGLRQLSDFPLICVVIGSFVLLAFLAKREKDI